MSNPTKVKKEKITRKLVIRHIKGRISSTGMQFYHYDFGDKEMNDYTITEEAKILAAWLFPDFAAKL